MRIAHRALAIALAVAGVLAAAAPALASWTHSGSGAPYAKALAMPTGATPTASASGRDVTVSWAQSTLGGSPVSGYAVKRYDTNGNAQTIGSACSGTVSGLSCTESAVPAGTWRYTVTPTQGNWLGTESSQSSNTVVAAPSLTLSGSTTLTSLPGTLSGSIAGYVTGQTVTFRLDNQSTGTVLTGSISPSPVASGGGASVSVTIPSGTANGSHTLYAIGSSGDVASASFTVTVTSTVSTSAWDLRDASAGAGEVDASAPTAVAGDGRTFATTALPAAFGTQHFDFDMSAPLPSGVSVSGAAFKLNLAAGATGDQLCFYIEVWRNSTNTRIASHGTTASPQACVTGTTLQATSTALPEVTSGAIADDVTIRVYARESGGRAATVDLATVTGTGAAAFTLYTDSYIDAVASPATTSPWGLVSSGDGTPYTSASTWATTLASARYLKLTFPAYVPAGATITGATFTHAFRATASGHTVCYYAEFYSGSTLIASRGSLSASYSCNSTTTYKTDAIVLSATSEVNSVARANGLIVKLYFNITSGGTRTTQHDLATLDVTYQ